MADTAELLAELEDKLILGEILESDYKELKWKLIRQARDRGEMLAPVEGMVTRTEARDNLGKVFCYVDAGPFLYGPDDEMSECKAAYYISKYPVTVKDWLHFLDDSGYAYPEEDLNEMLLISPDHNCPAVHVSWNDCKEYCRWLRRKTNEYYSLPHEIEWEKAARGVDGRFYPWGNTEPTEHMACYQLEDGPRHCTMPVTSHEANRSPYGCIDMVGNVWEWCLDGVEDPREPHILRGGSWCNDIDYCNALARTFAYPPDSRVDFGGFRLLYLPEELNAEYRKAYGGQGAMQEKLSLKVVSKPKVKGDSPAAAPTGLAAKLAAAAQKANQKQEEGPGSELAASIDELIAEHKETKEALEQARRQFKGDEVIEDDTANQRLSQAERSRRDREKAQQDRIQGTPIARRDSSPPPQPRKPTAAETALAGLADVSALDESLARAISEAAGMYSRSKEAVPGSLQDRLAKVRQDAANAGEEEITFLDVETDEDGNIKPITPKPAGPAAAGKKSSNLEFDALWVPGENLEPLEFSRRTTTIGYVIWALLACAVIWLLLQRIAGIGGG